MTSFFWLGIKLDEINRRNFVKKRNYEYEHRT